MIYLSHYLDYNTIIIMTPSLSDPCLTLGREQKGTASWNKFVRPRWPYVMRPSVCHCNSLGGAKWRSITGRTGRTDRQTDRRTDRVRRNMRPPPRDEGRIKTGRREAHDTVSCEVKSSNVKVSRPSNAEKENMAISFWTGRPTNFKLGTRTEYNDSHHWHALWLQTSTL